jgi:aryl-alcohol dehydrogenase-like predicted oxidoreductase
LTGRFQSPADFAEDDWRRHSPRFQGENFQRNLQLVERVKQIAARRGLTPAQLALAWLLARGQDVVPLFGVTQRRHLEENLGAVSVRLDADELRQIDEVAPKGAAAGARYPESGMRTVNR